MDTANYILQQIRESIRTKESILSDPAIIAAIEEAASLITEAYRRGYKTLVAGNGGSAADAQHFAAELVNKFSYDRPGIPSIALTTDSSILTSIGNDYGFDHLFARQIQALGISGDVFICISTSGNSANILQAIAACKEKGIHTIGLTGAKGGKMREQCDLCICIPSSETPRIQEAHILILHILCSIVEENLFGYLNPPR